jgi:hypothetical protein
MQSYSDILPDEWGVKQGLRARIRRVLRELVPEAQLLLMHHPALQVTVRPQASAVFSVWAYFPVHKCRRIVRQLADEGISARPSTRVLLVISEKLFGADVGNLRDHLGHVLLYLRHPRAKNDRAAASREWNASRLSTAKNL